MKRLHAIFALAGMIVIGMSHPTFAQTSPAPTAQSQAPAAAPLSSREAQKAQKKGTRMAARSDCRTRGKQQSLTGPALKDFVKSCMAQQH